MLIFWGNNKLTATHEYQLSCNCYPFFEKCSILTTGSNDFNLKIMESLLIEPLCEKCPNTEIFWYVFSCFPVFRFFLLSEYRKIQTKKTRYLDNFYAVNMINLFLTKQILQELFPLDLCSIACIQSSFFSF